MSAKSATMPRIRRAAIAAVLAGGALAAPVAAAHAVTPAISVGDGRLVANGAGITVPVTLSCADGSGSIYVSIVQRRGNATITGSTASAPAYSCDGGAQVIDALVQPENGAVFKAGEVVAIASTYICGGDPYTCTPVRVDGVIQVRR